MADAEPVRHLCCASLATCFIQLCVPHIHHPSPGADRVVDVSLFKLPKPSQQPSSALYWTFSTRL